MNLYNNIIKEYKRISKEQVIEYFCYIFVFIMFMGTNFTKITIGTINFSFQRLLMIFAAILVLAEVFKERKKYFDIKNKSIKFYLMFFIVWSIYSVISFLWIKDKYMYVVTNFNIVIGTFLIFYFIKNLKEVKMFENVLKIAILAVTLNCIYYLIIKKTFIAGFYYNTNDLATVLLFIIPSIIYFIYRDFYDLKRFLFRFIEYIICIFAFCFINSRGCMLGIVLGIIGIVTSFVIKNKEKIFKKRKIIIVWFILLSICLILGSYFLINFLKNFTFEPVKFAITSNQVRTNLIYNAIEFLKQDINFIRGIGAGNSVYYYQNYSVYTLNNTYSPHNLWIQILLEYGVIIFAFFVIVWLEIIVSLLKNIEKSKINYIFIFYMCAMLIACISSSTLLTREYFWIILAIVMAWIRTSKEN